MTTTNEHTERVELIQAIRNQLGYDFDPSDCFYEQSLLYRAAALLEAQPAEQAKGLDVAKFFLPPALHDGIAENTAGTYRLRVTGLTIRQIKDIFEDKFLGSMMWSNGAAYPTDGVEIRFLKDQPDTTPPAQPAREWVGLDEEKTEALIEGLAEWSRYVDVDHAHQTLEKHVRDVLEKHGIKEKQ